MSYIFENKKYQGRCKACDKEIEDNNHDELLEYCNKCYQVNQDYFNDISSIGDDL